MNLPDVPLLNLLREKMSWLNERQSVLAQNVANADVPGYMAHDLKPLDFEQVLKNSVQSDNVGLTVTDPRHISPGNSSSSFTETLAADSEATPSGGSVSPEQEMMKVADTQAQYQAATNLYAKSIQMMRTAIDR
jgi:flagellar basal-body rod protein FlgB